MGMKRRVMVGKEKIKFPEEGLLHYWALNGNAVDAKGGANGTASGVSYVTGVNGQAAKFIAGSYVQVPININLSQWTVLCWLNVRENIYSDDGIIIYRSGQKSVYGICYTGSTGRIYVYDGNSYVYSDYQMNPNTWNLLTLSCDGSGIKYYMNGKMFDSVGYKRLFLQNTSKIGRDDLSILERSFRGSIDEMAIWNRALSAEEVQLLYNQGKGLFYE